MDILPRLKCLNGRGRNFEIVESEDEEDEDDEVIEESESSEGKESSEFGYQEDEVDT